MNLSAGEHTQVAPRTHGWHNQAQLACSESSPLLQQQSFGSRLLAECVKDMFDIFFLFSFEKMEEYGHEKNRKSKLKQAIISVASPL